MHRVGESDQSQVVFADKSPLVTLGRVEYLIHPQHDVSEGAHPWKKRRGLENNTAVGTRPVELLPRQNDAAGSHRAESGHHH